MSGPRHHRIKEELMRQQAEKRELAERDRAASEAQCVAGETDRMDAERARRWAEGDRRGREGHNQIDEDLRRVREAAREKAESARTFEDARGDTGNSTTASALAESNLNPTIPAVPGRHLGPYLLEALIGIGGMGPVYRARDRRLDRDVAIKICRNGFTPRFEREARMVAALNHQNICTLHGIGPNYLVMEFVDGPTLADRIAERAVIGLEAIRIARQIVHGLAAAHRRGIVHRDLTPANIKIRADGVVKILDFGVSKMAANLVDATERATAGRQPVAFDPSVFGTLAYMSPEQAQGLPVDGRTDLWSLGIVLYQMLTQYLPFSGATPQATLHEVMQKATPSLVGAPPALQRIVERCLRKDRESRYPSADALGDALDACAAVFSKPAQPAQDLAS
jgi:eukaryotic-like serine/threonine-protein kinase